MRILITALMVILPVAMANAQSTPDEGGRYLLQRTDEGFFRVDRQSGKTSACTQKEGDWVCRLVADDRAAFEEELSRLNEEVTALRKERDALLEQSDTAKLPEAPKAPNSPQGGGDEIDQAMDKVEDMVRRFLDAMQGLKDDLEKNSGT